MSLKIQSHPECVSTLKTGIATFSIPKLTTINYTFSRCIQGILKKKKKISHRH